MTANAPFSLSTGCPSLIRGDRGKENLVVGEMQVAFHLRRLGNRAKECFRMGKSVHNQVSQVKYRHFLDQCLNVDQF